MNNPRPLLLLLLCLVFLTAACDSSALRDLPLVSQFPPATPTVTPLPTATPSPVPGASGSPPPTQTPTLAPTATGTLSTTPEPTSTGTVSATIIDTPIPTPTLAPAPVPATAQEIARGDASRPWIALTFDAGSDISPLPSILDTLGQKDVRCTFFITGIMLRQADGPELLQRLVAEGHELGNHSDTHPDFTLLTDEQMGFELAEVENAVRELTARSTKPYFRPPFGSRDDRVWRVVQENGYVSIYWTYHVCDTLADTSAGKVYSCAIEAASNGAIVLMHVAAWETAEKLPDIIDELRARGYRLVTLSELLAS